MAEPLPIGIERRACPHPSGEVLRFIRDAILIAARGASIWAVAYRGVPLLQKKVFAGPVAVSAAQ